MGRDPRGAALVAHHRRRSACSLLWVVVAVTVPLWAWAGPRETVGERLQSPNWTHLLGTDALGRDVLHPHALRRARVDPDRGGRDRAHGADRDASSARIAGFLGGVVDQVVMRIIDIMLAFPPIFLAMAVTAAFGPGLAQHRASRWSSCGGRSTPGCCAAR